jgi:predicted phage terminase large subunit-like protein
LRLPKLCSAEEWSTAARFRTRDSQPSFKALGLATGFVGQGADTLIIDDPYASPEEAYSQVINAKVHSFWSDTAKPRLNDQTNVVVMFHRYTENDLAGWLMEQEPDEWELIRYAAEADGDYKHPATGKQYADPLDRPIGEYLSPRYSKAWYERQQENAFVWLSQFQGRPTPKEGAFFKVAEFEIIEPQVAAVMQRLGAIVKTVRAWDLAAKPAQGDYTVGVKMGKGPNGELYVLDVVRGQWSPDERNKVMLQTAQADGRATRIRLPQDPGQAGVDQKLALIRLLAGFVVHTERVSGSKETRADGFAAQVNGHNVKLVQGGWNRPFIEELRSFPLGKNDDQVDSASDAFQELAAPMEWKTA